MLAADTGPSDRETLSTLKEAFGRCIERARRRRQITQTAFARDVGMSVRWLRELEGGNPALSLDDHVRCARRLEIPLGQLLFPLLYLSRGLAYPFPLASLDTAEIEDRCVTLIAERNSRILRHYLNQEHP